ncbi:MAG TPA: division/cell wall cluster transcriptional repressor MraZ [Vicinamibacteria bacterium]|nr:division/cell wall cluster transcriptional repressor MraZ [Vicinamibacteria bacterium]
MLRGNHPARVDEKGRLKVPVGFLQLIETNYGLDVFVTSLSGDNVRIYPMDVWTEFERRLKSMPDFHPTKVKLLKRVHFYGQASSLDRQGRLLIPQQLREPAQMNGTVDVLGMHDHLEVWNHDYLAEQLQQEPFTVDDHRALTEYDI